MRIIGNIVGYGGDLRLKTGMGGHAQIGWCRNFCEVHQMWQRPVVLEYAFKRFPRQIQPVMFGIAIFKQRDDAQRLNIVVETTEGLHGPIKRPLAGVAERGVTEIVTERDGLGQILVQTQRPSNRACNLADFQSVSQAVPEVPTFMGEKHLRLVL